MGETQESRVSVGIGVTGWRREEAAAGTCTPHSTVALAGGAANLCSHTCSAPQKLKSLGQRRGQALA